MSQAAITWMKEGFIDSRIDSLLRMAVDGLSSMFSPEEGLFCHRVVRNGLGLKREGVSKRYTFMTLLGLHRAAQAGYECSVDRRTVWNRVRAEAAHANNLGDLGLYLWTAAAAYPEQLTHVVAECELTQALSKYPDAKERRTMELSWFLTGLSKMILGGHTKDNIEELAFRTYGALMRNRGPHGLFGHQSGGILGSVRGAIGTFADQVYPIYALTSFAQATGHEEALDHAMRCATAICELQGELGQWWWHYNSRTGKICGRYPVYAVHQDAMAPMALLPLARVAGVDFADNILKGVDWICGANELATDLRDVDQKLVWRCLYQSRAKEFIEESLALAGFHFRAVPLAVRFEDRPYHWGWVLYAFAGQSLNSKEHSLRHGPKGIQKCESTSPAQSNQPSPRTP